MLSDTGNLLKHLAQWQRKDRKPLLFLKELAIVTNEVTNFTECSKVVFLCKSVKLPNVWCVYVCFACYSVKKLT